MKNPEAMAENLTNKLIKIGKSYDIDLKQSGLNSLYCELTKKLHSKFKIEPVVIIDEYDMPFNYYFNDLINANKFIEQLKDFYLGIKNKNNIHLIFLTGNSNYLILN